jgi:hypothetical protein
VYCASAGLLIDHDLAAAIGDGRLPLLTEWQLELQQQWRRRAADRPLVLLAAGLSWQPPLGRDPQQPRCCPLPERLRPVLLELAAGLGARLVELDGQHGGAGLGRDDLLEAPLLLVATERATTDLLGAGLLRQQPGQRLSLLRPGDGAGQLRRERLRGLRPVPADDLDGGLEDWLQDAPQGRSSGWVPLLLLPAALLLGVLLWWWTSRVFPGLLLIGTAWWWLERQPGPRERNRSWCCEQLLALQRLWADFGLAERVRDQLQEGGWTAEGPPSLLQALQAHRLHLELVRSRPGPWQRADLVDAQRLFEQLAEQLHRGERRQRRRQRWLLVLAGVLGLTLLLAAVLEQSWTDAVVLPAAALLAGFNLQRPIPLLPPLRRTRALAVLAGPLDVLRQAQRRDDLSAQRREVEQAVLAAGRELVDVVNDSLSAGTAAGQL